MDQTEIDQDRSDTRNGIQVIARAAAVLRALKDNPTGLSLGQIAERVGLARSTVQRIVQALQDERLVIGSANGGGIRLGPELHSLAGAARFNVVERCRPFLEKLMEQTGETVDLSVLRGGRMIFLDQVQGRHRLRAVSSVGEVFPLTVTANGRACLSLLPEAEARKLAEAEWARGTATGDWPTLARQLAQVRRTGLAEDDGEHTEGIIALGFAFTDLAGDLHAISVPVPTSRWPEMRGRVTEALTTLRAEIAHIFEG
ncbi:IclR family transcriptional regulator [Tabrizicola sp. J26]|uniref:IclR family transcriptional regulator n=1 Tax=Alitabrizicola rongguiensis TaxID=2909234 RepID=UPI001F2B741B|nr:IclR family transcriptional regulator [Tabrizicola rongguiensis]MCF1710305.1 IclR family transcriptional regulator [Tabrizicola rongguiensis]